MPVEIDTLGSARFGATLARTTDTSASPEKLNAAAADLGVDMLTTRLDCGNHPRIHALEADGHQIMDSLVYYARPLNTAVDTALVGIDLDIQLATSDDGDAVADLTRLGFRGYFGHFHTDPKLDTLSADAAYVEWAETSIRKVTPSSPALVARIEGQIVGYLTLRRNAPDEWEMVLSAVHPSAQGKGVYGHLVAASINLARTHVTHPEQARIIVSTQLNNYPVQRAWSHKGFFIDRGLHTFHKWY